MRENVRKEFYGENPDLLVAMDTLACTQHVSNLFTDKQFIKPEEAEKMPTNYVILARDLAAQVIVRHLRKALSHE
jgi:hypothetical protein